jgi:protein O-mannosyl-transferase
MTTIHKTIIRKQQIIACILLTLITIAIYWQVSQFDFVNLDDHVYVTENFHIKLGKISLNGLRWTFSTTYAEFWQPLTWVSLIADHQLYGLDAGGYHLTNLILHILSTLLLFWLFNRMTGTIWQSAFIAALFAIHPLHVETVTWITKRKDVLSAFWWMLTLCLYVYYTEKPMIKRYLLVIFSFVCALMSKPMVVTLPAILMLLDYWPLRRFESYKRNRVMWQLKEKSVFFALSAIFSVITFYARYDLPGNEISVVHRMASAPVSFVTYLVKSFWPHNLAVFYPFSGQIPTWHFFLATLLIIVISVAVIILSRRLPYLFVGWFWYAITILPVIGVFYVSTRVLSDNYTYVPLVGMTIGIAWGVPALFSNQQIRKILLYPTAIIILLLFSFLAWKQCGYWKNNFELWNHACLVTKGNYLAYNNLASELAKKSKMEEAIDFYNKAIDFRPDLYLSYNGRGLAYDTLGQNKRAVEDYNEALRLKPDYAEAYYNRGNSYDSLGQYRQAIQDYHEAIRLKPDYVQAYHNRGNAYFSMGNNEDGCRDAQKACMLGYCRLLEFAQAEGHCR